MVEKNANQAKRVRSAALLATAIITLVITGDTQWEPCQTATAASTQPARGSKVAVNAPNRNVLDLLQLWVLAKSEATCEAALALYQMGNDPNVASSLSNSADKLRDSGRETEALLGYEAALAIYQRAHGNNNDPDVAAALDKVAQGFDAAGRPDEALPKARAALAMYQRLHGNQDDPDVGYALDNVAYALRSTGREDEALSNYETELAMYQRLCESQHDTNDSIRLGETLILTADYLSELGRSGDALPKYEAACAICQHLIRVPFIASSLAKGFNGVASCLMSLGRPGEALLEYETEMVVLQRYYKGKDNLELALDLENTAECLESLGRPEEALPNCEAALAMYKRLHGNQNHPEVANALIALGKCLEMLGRSEQALPKYEAALAMDVRVFGGKDHWYVVESLGNVGQCLLGLKRNGEALAKGEAALAMSQRLAVNHDHPVVVVALKNVGTCLFEMGRREEALSKFQAALAMDERLHSPNTYASAYELGSLEALLGNDHAAEKAFAESILAIEDSRRLLGGDDQDRLAFMSSLRQGEDPFSLMVRLQLKLGKPEMALQYAEEGRSNGLLDILQRGNRLSGGDLLEPVFRKAKEREDTRLLKQIEAARQERQAAEKAVTESQAALELAPRRTELSVVDRGKLVEGLQRDLQRAQDRAGDADRVVQNLAKDQAIGDLKTVDAATVQKMLQPGQYLLEYSRTYQGAAVILVPPYGEKIEGYTLHWADGKEVTEKGLDDAVDAYLKSMMEEGRLRGVERPTPATEITKHGNGFALFQALVPAAVWAKIKNAAMVYVVPDGAMNRIPFESLVVDKPATEKEGPSELRYWLDEGPPIAYGPSATVLLNRMHARDAQLKQAAAGIKPVREMVALGDPIFSRANPTPAGVPMFASARGAEPTVASTTRDGFAGQFGELKPLPGTGKEVLSIYKSLTGHEYSRTGNDPRFDVLLGEDATEPKLAAAAAGARFLHLATHGLVETGDRAVYSSLALTQPINPTPDDIGFLTLQDLFDHWWGKLARTELVVLSACDSQGLDQNAGNLQTGEGAFGLPWGFMYAGSPAVIASLWEVDDASTADLMSGLYATIERNSKDPKNPGKLEAFTAVRKQLRKSHPEPFYWAPFIYLGDPR